MYWSGWDHTLHGTLTRSVQSRHFPMGPFEKSRLDLVARIAVATGDVREMPNVFEKVCRSLCRRCNACITAGGRFFEKFL
ncbi:hypothetical protein AVEN_49656-1 [Araneus ventricosus]|uniref:Uncharacterized protein n=1 Tax=Araneus ventricosus TaxID=182803 RepID=A0A4Y2U4F5_ARAVE|nr:hypothetical protein AVEN_49656-1 [Araneus ventricosus]